MLGQAGRCKYTTILLAREKQVALSQGSISHILRHNELDQKKNCVSVTSYELYSWDVQKTMTENRNDLSGWTLALLETAQSMQSQERGGGLGEPEHLSNDV